VSGCAEVTGVGLEALAPVGMLRELNVGMLRRMDGEGMAAVGALASLTSLSINASAAVTAENIAKITGAWPFGDEGVGLGSRILLLGQHSLTHDGDDMPVTRHASRSYIATTPVSLNNQERGDGRGMQGCAR